MRGPTSVITRVLTQCWAMSAGGVSGFIHRTDIGHPPMGVSIPHRNISRKNECRGRFCVLPDTPCDGRRRVA